MKQKDYQDLNPATSQAHLRSIRIGGIGSLTDGLTWPGTTGWRRCTRKQPASLPPRSPPWCNPSANYNVYALAVQPDGKILVGGGFGTLGGQTRIGLHGLSRCRPLRFGARPVWPG